MSTFNELIVKLQNMGAAGAEEIVTCPECGYILGRLVVDVEAEQIAVEISEGCELPESAEAWERTQHFFAYCPHCEKRRVAVFQPLTGGENN